jgi:hypothetical protein
LITPERRELDRHDPARPILLQAVRLGSFAAGHHRRLVHEWRTE